MSYAMTNQNRICDLTLLNFKLEEFNSVNR